GIRDFHVTGVQTCALPIYDLVDKEAALAPADFIDVEVTVFPKGHGAIATSWSLPTSECALHRCFKEGYRGPVRYQLDLDGIPERSEERRVGKVGRSQWTRW